MTDIAVLFNNSTEKMSFETAISKGDLEHDSGLKSAVLYSLFTDRMAQDGEHIPDETGNRRGHWADSFNNDSEGSGLWLLSREKQTTQTLNRAVMYAHESLQWLIDDKIASDISIHASWLATGLFSLHIIITLVNGLRYDDVFNTRL